ncbi:hypothetical protein ILUMI_26502 [Ignelater luminosus]|uniref:Uncharacterized protein n=1 Tax=Ignelater luminosus TaxID=2038154 RepID=A0A8K0C5P6_IGNLU|nr:hypothetical protein ILUMI_26502 [Ignelater luminosus]
MEKTDKAVSTEDLCIEPPRTMCLEAAKLEAVFKTLVENKVEAIKNNKVRLSSVHSSPKSLVNRLRITSSSSAASSKDNHQHRSHCHHSPNRKHRRRRKSCDEDELTKDIKRARRSGRSKHRVSSSSPESPRYRMHRCCDRRAPFAEEEAHETLEFLHCDSICSADDYISMAPNSHPCCCPNERNGQM